MCGIVGYVGKNNNALPILLDGLKSLEYRGYDSAGIAFVNKNKVEIIKEQGKIINLEKKVDCNVKSNLGIGHTRWATHGIPNKINAHPHKVGKVTLVHNGIIENYTELRSILEEIGYVFKSDTDSEVLAALIDRFYQEKSNIIKVLDKVRNLLEGSYALGIIFDDDLETLYAIRKDSPLIIALGTDENYIASDVPAILKYTNKYILLENDEIVALKYNQFSIYKNYLKKINKKVQTFSWNIDTAMKNGYDHFMIKEINEQPIVMKNTKSSFFLEFDNIIPDITKYKNIDIVACGSAYHAGLIGKYLIEKYGDIKVNVEVASEYRYKKLFFNDNTLVIIVSQSGETADSLKALRLVKTKGIDTLAIVNTVGSSIAREAKYVFYIKAGCEIAVATTKAYTAQVLTLALIALKFKLNKSSEKSFNKSFDNFIEQANALLENYSKYQAIAKDIYLNNDVFFIGRNIDYALCMEGSLKLKEISYIHSEAYPAGELKHGTISLIEKDTPVIAIVTDEEIAAKTISNIKEVKARGAKVTLIIKEKLNEESDYYDNKIIIPDNNDLLTPILAIIPMQIIAYEIAKLRGCDIDKPRNLAKSVTVE